MFQTTVKLGYNSQTISNRVNDVCTISSIFFSKLQMFYCCYYNNFESYSLLTGIFKIPTLVMLIGTLTQYSTTYFNQYSSERQRKCYNAIPNINKVCHCTARCYSNVCSKLLSLSLNFSPKYPNISNKPVTMQQNCHQNISLKLRRCCNVIKSSLISLLRIGLKNTKIHT